MRNESTQSIAVTLRFNFSLADSGWQKRRMIWYQTTDGAMGTG